MCHLNIMCRETSEHDNKIMQYAYKIQLTWLWLRQHPNLAAFTDTKKNMFTKTVNNGPHQNRKKKL